MEAELAAAEFFFNLSVLILVDREGPVVAVPIQVEAGVKADILAHQILL